MTVYKLKADVVSKKKKKKGLKGKQIPLLGSLRYWDTYTHIQLVMNMT